MRDFFVERSLLQFKLANPVLISRDDRWHIRVRDPIQKLLHLALDLDQLRLIRLRLGLERPEPLIPQLLKYRPRGAKQILRRRRPLEQHSELALQHLPLDRLSVASATSPGAQVVRIPIPPSADRPARRHRRPAIGAQNKPAKRKIGADVLARRRFGAFRQALLNLPITFSADERFMMTFAQRHSPSRRFNETCIDRTGQNIRDVLVPDSFARGFRKFRSRLQKPFDFRLDLKPSAGEPFKRVLDDRCQRLIPDQHLSLAIGFLVAVSHRHLEHIKTLLDARLHFLNRLPATLQAFELTLRSDNRLDELAFGSVLELEIEALHRRVVRGQPLTQTNMKFRVPSEALQIIKDNHVVITGAATQESQHRDHPGAAHEIAAAGHVVAKYGVVVDYIAASRSIFTAAVLLTMKSITFVLLFGVRDAAVNDCPFRVG